MFESARILCAVDFSGPAQAALERAVALSRDRGLELTILRAIPATFRFNWRARERIVKTEALRREAAAAGVSIRVTEQHGDPADVIVLHANTGRFDLLIMGTHGRTGLERFRNGSIAERVMQRVRCPVLIVPVSEGRRAPLAPFQNIVCPIDLTRRFDPALHPALELVRDGGRLTLVHICRALSPLSGSRYAHHAAPDQASRLQLDAWRLLQDAVPGETRGRADVHARVVSGPPVAEIVRVASEVDADLIVMGLHSRGAMGGKLVGSITASVIRAADRPVLVVPARRVKRPRTDPEPERAGRLAA